jgi:uncharacterized protein YkwD
MRTVGKVLAGLSLVAVAGCSSVSAGVGGPNMGVGAGVTLPVSSRGEMEALSDRINRHRVAMGCRPLIRDNRLAAVARRHSEDMVRRRFFDHTNPDGRDPFDRLRAAGIRYRAAAENIAQGQTRGRDTYDDWMESKGHRHNIENCKYTHFGIGVYQRTWTLELARYAN